jgi:SAM-dependent methyltransferase
MTHNLENRCAICGGNSARKLFEKNGYPLIRCQQCGVIFVPKSAFGESISMYYEEGYFTGDAEATGYPDYREDESLLRRNFANRLTYLEEIRPPGRILDVGAAYGYFLDEARNRGWTAFGIDVSAHAAAEAKKNLGIDIEAGDFLEHDFGEHSFDVITMFDVVEHFEEPALCIEKAYKLLKEDGLLAVETGDTDSIPARLLRSKWYFYNPPQHIFYFSKQNLCSVLKDGGFCPDFLVKRVSRRVSVRNLVFKFGSMTRVKFLKQPLLRLQKKISNNLSVYVRFGDDIFVIAGKSENSFRHWVK